MSHRSVFISRYISRSKAPENDKPGCPISKKKKISLTIDGPNIILYIIFKIPDIYKNMHAIISLGKISWKYFPLKRLY